ncbi:hypothetical protein IAT40_002690 [Kwoniella sp. CBS 6097]
MLSVRTGLCALRVLVLARSGLAAPAPAAGEDESDVQYLPSLAKRDDVSAPLFADEGPTYKDVLLQRSAIIAEGDTSGTWFDAPLAAYAVSRKSEVKDHFAIGDHQILSEVEVNFEAVTGRKTYNVLRADTGAKNQDVWWAGALRTAAAKMGDIGVDGLSGDGTINEGKPDQALRLLTGKDATITKDPSVADQLKYAERFAESPVVFGFAKNEKDDDVFEWRAVIGYKKEEEEDDKPAIVEFYQISSDRTPDLVLGEGGVLVREIAHLEDILD